MKISVAIIAQDEADRIAACVSSARFADDIVVVDSGSKDDTPQMAEAAGGRVFHIPWQGYARQKQAAVDLCRNDWVLLIDADEKASPKLAAKIKALNPSHLKNIAAFYVYRKNFFHGRWIRRCGWWPEREVRLLNRTKGKFSDHLVHERWLASGTIKQIDAHIEHHSYQNYADIIEKLQRYSTLAARQLAREGHTAYWWEPVTHGGWMFFRTYLLQRGALDGFDGLVISLSKAGGSFLKYAKLLEAQRHRGNSLTRK